MLGRFTVNRRCRVAIMSGESGLGTLQETVRRILAAKFLSPEDAPGLIFSPDLPQTDNARHQVALRDFLRADDIELAIIDPAYLCLPCDDNGNLFKQGAVLRMLTDVCREAGASVALCHHTRPIADNRPATLQDLAWAGFKEFARQWWLLNRRIDFDPKSPGEHRLWLTLGGSAGFNSLWGLNINEGQITDTGGRRWEVSTLNAADAIETVKRQASKGKQAKTQDQLNQDVAALLEVAPAAPRGRDKEHPQDRGGGQRRASQPGHRQCDQERQTACLRGPETGSQSTP